MARDQRTRIFRFYRFSLRFDAEMVVSEVSPSARCALSAYVGSVFQSASLLPWPWTYLSEAARKCRTGG